MLLLSLIITLILSLVVYLGATKFELVQFNQLHQEENKLKIEIDQKYQLYNKLPLYAKMLPVLARLQNDITSRFTQANEQATLLIQINQLAEDEKIQINNFTPQISNELFKLNSINNDSNSKINNKINSDTNIISDSYLLNIQASYMNFVKFIYQITKLPELIEINNLKIIRVDDTTINVTLNLKIFYRRN